MIQITNVPITLNAAMEVEGLVFYDRGPLMKAASRALGLRENTLTRVRLTRRGIDARKKTNVHYVCTLEVECQDARVEECLVEDGKATRPKPYEPLDIPVCSRVARPVVVGLGPAGLFAALYLARAGLRPIVLERGPRVDRRAAAVDRFNRTGELDTCANIQFGEGGAGMFSDGKLTTNTKNPLSRHVLQWFVDAGAPRDILWKGKPHIGSDLLPGVVETMRNRIKALGGSVLFDTQLTHIHVDHGEVSGVSTKQVRTGEESRIDTDTVILACGHSARDTITTLFDEGVQMEPKPFSVGVRIEHPQKSIDKGQWGDAAKHPSLGAAEYKMAVHLPGGRSAYTFCMCPGGTVVAAASEEGGVVTNGMSNYARDGINANAALLVNVEPADFGSDHPLAGFGFQRAIEQRAFRSATQAGGAAYSAPCQTVADFLGHAASTATVTPTYPRGTVACDLHDVLPAFIAEALEQALPAMDRKLHGFADGAAVMTAAETRSSSPVRIPRSAQLLAHVRGEGDEPCECRGLYPAGEGAGYAGGIMSAAVDGLRVAQHVVATLS